MSALTVKPRELFDHLREIGGRVRGAGHVFLFLDFDGTLAPIVDDPGMAAMPETTRELLVRLGADPKLSVALLSGRALPDLQRRVGVEGLVYAGDHGFAIEGPGIDFEGPARRESVEELPALLGRIGDELARIPGALLEQKGFTASVHYRHVPQDLREEVRRIVAENVAARGEFFRMTEGLEVLEIRPRVKWDKGEAAQWILNAASKPGALPVCLGDDTTDEDAFRALREGITVRVGQESETAADYRIPSQAQVETFLVWLGGVMREPRL